MMVVHRFPISVPRMTVPTFHQSEILGVYAAGDGAPSLYILHDPSSGVRIRKFRTVATGEEIDIDSREYGYELEYVGTYSPSMGYVFHVFEYSGEDYEEVPQKEIG